MVLAIGVCIILITLNIYFFKYRNGKTLKFLMSISNLAAKSTSKYLKYLQNDGEIIYTLNEFRDKYDYIKIMERMPPYETVLFKFWVPFKLEKYLTEDQINFLCKCEEMEKK